MRTSGARVRCRSNAATSCRTNRSTSTRAPTLGRVLGELVTRADLRLSRSTLLLVLGDARNNHRPPRADLLARLRATVRRVVWLNPEPRERWNSGDSVIATYARHVDVLLAAHTPRTLHAALGELTRAAL